MFVEEDSMLVSHFQFKNFIESLEFANEVGALAEVANHHPNILLHDYKKVTISLTTHDAGGRITDKDHLLARQITELYERK